jgi:hypothetical protein
MLRKRMNLLPFFSWTGVSVLVLVWKICRTMIYLFLHTAERYLRTLQCKRSSQQNIAAKDNSASQTQLFSHF